MHLCFFLIFWCQRLVYFLTRLLLDKFFLIMFCHIETYYHNPPVTIYHSISYIDYVHLVPMIWANICVNDATQ